MSLTDDVRGLAKGTLALREKVLAGALAVVTVVAAIGWITAWTRGVRLDSADSRKALAEGREAEAVQGARDASSYSSEMIRLQEECRLEMERVAGENAAAVERARAEGERAGREQEAYEQKLAAPADPTCRDFTEMVICPELRDY